MVKMYIAVIFPRSSLEKVRQEGTEYEDEPS